jgi:Ig-like domain-containing protein
MNAPAWKRRLALVAASLAALCLVAPRSLADDARRKQEIQLGELPQRLVSDAPFTPVAKATSGLPVAFEIVDGPAVMDGKKVRLTGATGLVIVRATQQGNVAFQPATPAERAFSVVARPLAPSIEVQPASAQVGVGEPLVLFAAAKGEPAPTYQWRKNGVAVTDGSAGRLVISSASPDDAGSYDVVATNDSGRAVSVSAQVTVGKRRQSISFPSIGSVTSGQSIPLTASASSGLPVEYRVIAGVATLSGSSLTPLQGNVVVEADQGGNASYEAAAPVTQTFLVMPNASGVRFP